MSEKSGPAVTIKDVAGRLGMSHTTVSRALNDSGQISDQTKRRVREAAEALGYVPNFSARAMRGDNAPLFALSIPEIRNDFYASIAKEFADRCRGAGARMLLAVTGDDPLVEEQEIKAFLGMRVTGLVVTLTSAPTAATRAMLSSVPSVQMVREISGLATPVVRLEEERGCRSAVEHLLAEGHRRIAYIGTDGSISSGRDRVLGFLAALAAAGVAPMEGGMEMLSPSERSGFEGMTRLLGLPKRPTALVIGTSQLTIGGLSAMRAAGVSVPQNISVVSYGDASWFPLLTPPMTCVALPIGELVNAAIECIRFVSSGPVSDPICLPTKLIVRSSTAPPAA